MRPPEIDAGNGEPEKRQIAGAGDGASRGAAFAFGAEPAVPIDDVAHEIVGGRLSAEDLAVVGVYENGIVAAEIDRHRRGGIGLTIIIAGRASGLAARTLAISSS